MILHQGGVEVKSGGVRVDGGGVEVTSGGMVVDGGFTLKSGEFTLATSQGLNVNGGGIVSSSTSDGASAVHAQSTTDTFRGSVVKSEGPTASNTYRLYEGVAGGQAVFSVDGEGSLSTKHVTVNGESHTKGDMKVCSLVVIANET